MLALPRLALFDLDGTLIEFHKEFLFSEADRLIQEAGFSPVHRSVLEECFSDFDFFKFLPSDAQAEFMEFFWQEFDYDSTPIASPIDGACEVLRHFREKDIPCCIVTARISGQMDINGALNSVGMLEYLSDIVTRPGEHVKWTDKTSMILDACRRFDVCPQDALMAGDIPTDITCAKEVGIGTTVAVLSGGIKETVLAQAAPDYLVESVGSMLEWLHI